MKQLDVSAATAAAKGGHLPATAAARAPVLQRTRADRQPGARSRSALWTSMAWFLTLLFFAPVAWMFLTSLHREADAAANPPSLFAPLTWHS
jgi:sorbitol/mannitol transport system permease protein